VLKLSRASSVLLLIIYILYLLFHLKSHAYLTRVSPTHISKPESDVETLPQRNRSSDCPRISTSSPNPPPMRFVNRNGRVFYPISVPDDEIELPSIENYKSSSSRSDTGDESKAVLQTFDDVSRTSQTNYNTESRPSTNERPFSRSRASGPPFLSYNISPNQAADYLGTHPSISTSISRPASFTLLLTASALVSISAFFLTDTIDAMVADTPLSEAFIGLIILPIAGNAAEHITAMTVASKNKMDLAIGVSVGSSIQIALCVTPAVVLLGWGMGKDMSLYFSLFETVTLVAAAGVVVVVILNGRTNYLEGWLLCACYIMVR
jgi:Ca2+/H+ antiporter